MTNQEMQNIHTTPLGAKRIKRNLNLTTDDVVLWCKQKIKQAKIERKGKNWYATTDNCIITINANSLTIITAHLIKCRMSDKIISLCEAKPKQSALEK